MNPIHNKDADRLNGIFSDLRTKTVDELKLLYKNRRKTGPDQYSLGGAGLGIIDMFRKSNSSVDFDILPFEKNQSILCYRVTV
jgi:hypothetical protein